MRQVVANLVSNAVKFTTRGGVVLTAQIEARGADCEACLTVKVTDTGPGIPEEKRERLFKPFSQADATVTRRHGGTGLGLWIARRICALMDGDLTYRMAPRGGAMFTATFGITATRAAGEAAQDAPLDVEAVLRARNWQILAAEDNKTNRLVLHHMLKRYPIVLTMVENGVEAVTAYRGGAYDLVLMDVNMPVMGGLEATSVIRAYEQAEGRPHCPVIALTANAMTYQVEEYLRRGIDAHVAKPVKRDVLAQRMADLLVRGAAR